MSKAFMEQLKEHKPEVIVGGVAAAAAVALYLRSKKGAATATTAAPSTTAGYLYPSGAMPGTTVATTTGTDAYTGMENQILGLQQAFLGLQTQNKAKAPGTAPPVPVTPPATKVATNVNLAKYTAEAFAGQGYYISNPGGGRASGAVRGTAGSIFATIASYTATLAQIEAGGVAYYESSLGGFTPITSAGQLAQVEGSTKQTTTWAKA